ncbi:uncharacterized protein LOC131691596 [Topomyia yanbarensis]|uniref:uncharacterized protein LOC131691596 n=1 Tax=Topomyia yanbarensis TaxID=2498891 RepID=UPI00273C4B22|nr:uncharacterized protein LOC131691596 [Topomyia yanbarensis]
MGKTRQLSKFCRLCLVETKNRVVVFPEGSLVENRVENLIQLVEIELDHKTEPGAVICFECVATLESFRQFKSQCHENDKYMRTLCNKTRFVEVLEEQTDDQFFDEEAVSEHETNEVIKSPAKPKSSSPKKNVSNSPERSSTLAKIIKPLNEHKVTKCAGPKIQPKIIKKPEMPVLAESYPEYFYFEKGPRSVNFTLVFYGERYNSAIYCRTKTYWQCMHRKKYRCDAQVCVTNDYQFFERRREHSHSKIPEQEGKIFMPLEALPKIFEVCYEISSRKCAKYQQPRTAQRTVTPASNINKKQDGKLLDKELMEKTRCVANVDDDRIVDESFYDKHNDDNSSKEDCSDHRTEIQSKFSNATVKRKLSITPIKSEVKKANLSIAKLENTGVKTPSSKKIKLADSYPDFFYFERGPRSVYFTLVFYGERYNSARYTLNYTYWQCIHRRKYECSAVVCVSNDYTFFERRREHTHGKLPEKEGKIFTPLQALPLIFQICKNMERHRRTGEPLPPLEQIPTNDPSEEDPIADNDTPSTIKKKNLSKPFDTSKIAEEFAVQNVPSSGQSGPVSNHGAVLADSYPNFFYFEKGARSYYYTLVFYGKRYNSALFTANYTYWQCIHRRKHRCSAQVCVTNDYKFFEQRHEHSHGDLPEKAGEIFTPFEALPVLFEVAKKVINRKRLQSNVRNAPKYVDIVDILDDANQEIDMIEDDEIRSHED